MKEQKTLDSFNSMSVSQAVIRNAIPAMAAMLMTLIYNLADTFFIGQTHDAYQVAAVSLASPVFLIFMSVGMIFGIGGTSVISRAMGKGRKDYAKRISSFCFWSCIVIGIILSCLSLLFMDNILVLVGASADTWNLAKDYLTIVSYGGVFVLISNCFSSILRAEGQATKAMFGQILGNLLNVIFDPIMILGFGWDIKGAAIATLIGNFAAAMYYIFYFFKGKSQLSIHIKDFSYKEKICSSVLSIGIPASLASLLMSVSHIILNGIMVGYGDMAVAGGGVAMKVTMLSGMLTIGIGQGVQPLLGYCVGAKKWERYNKILKFSLIFAFIVSLVMTALCYLFTNQIVSAFLTDANAFDYAVSFSRILLTTSIFFGIFYVITNAIQAMGAVIPSLIINLSRQGIIYIPALYILNIFSNANILMFAQPVADILSIALAVILYIFTSKKIMREQK
jgi:multidrug efflux pump